MSITPMRLRAFAALAALVLAGCGDESVVNPTFGAGCAAGALAPGQSVDGVLNGRSCFIEYNFWSTERTPYASYTVRLEKGKGYYFLMQVRPDADGLNEVDPLLTLYGKNADGVSVPLALSDDEAEGATGYDSEFYFIAPWSGTFQLVAASYGSTEFGGYRLSMESCPVAGRLDTAGVYANLEFRNSRCIRRSTRAGGFTTPLVLFSVPVARGEDVGITVTSDDFDPVAEFGGPDFDVYGNLYEGYPFVWGTLGTILNVLDAEVAGNYTLAVGSEAFSTLGRFRVQLSRTPAPTLMGVQAPAVPTLKVSPAPKRLTGR